MQLCHVSYSIKIETQTSNFVNFLSPRFLSLHRPLASQVRGTGQGQEEHSGCTDVCGRNILKPNKSLHRVTSDTEMSP